jgi:hypothetical protein
LQDRTTKLREQIAQVNEREDVRPFVEAVTRAQEALLRGPDVPEDETQPTPEVLAEAFWKRHKKLEGLLPSVLGTDQDNINVANKALRRAGDCAGLQKFNKANAELDRLEKRLHRLGGDKLFEKQMKEAIKKAARLVDPEVKEEVEGLLKEAIAALNAKNLEQAYVYYQHAARKLRNPELEQELEQELGRKKGTL